MSTTIDYFFNHPKPLDELASELRGWIGCDLRPYEGNSKDLYCRLLGMEFSLGVHQFKRDGDLDFENFRYRLDIRTPLPDADFRTQAVITMAFLAYAMYRRMGVTGMLVFDGQRLLARYEERRGAEAGECHLNDTVSNEAVRFPHYLASLLFRLPGGALSDKGESSMIEYLRSIGRDVRPLR